MRRPALSVFLACLAAGWMPAAHAVFKCASDGQVVYRDTPCPAGRQSVIDVPAGNPADAAAAHRRAANEQAALAGIEKRHAEEDAAAARAMAAAARSRKAQGIHGAGDRQCALLAKKAEWAAEDAGDAPARTAHKARQKARRAAETRDLHCGK